MRVYISGKITGLAEKQWKHNFNRAENKLRYAGYDVVNPIKLPIEVENPTWRDYMKVDLRELTKCDKIFMLKGWITSKGAWTELIFAKILGLEVMFDE